METSKTDIVVLAVAKAKPGKEAELESALREVAGPTRKQPGCVQFALCRAAGDASTIVGYERWASEEAHQQHLKGAHVQKLMARMAGVLAGPPTIVSYEVLDA
jgi:quinol monooxygenase YgiN